MGPWLAVGVVLALLGAARASDDPTRPPGRAGMEAHVDPGTGALVPEPTDTVRPPALPVLQPPAAEIPAPGGGMMIDIRGRFMSSVVATVAPDGSVHLDCLTDDGAAHVHR